MAGKAEIEQKTEELVTPIIDENHFELVDVEYVKEGANWYLRIYADKEGGISIDDCVPVSYTHLIQPRENFHICNSNFFLLLYSIR